jgi:membrane protease YdiL (CAAX protease family)
VPFTLVSFSAVLIYTWLVEPRTPRSVVAAPVLIVIVLGVVHAARAREWGFKARALAAGLGASTLFTVAASAAVLAVGTRLGTVQARPDPLSTLGGLIVWGGAQQWMLQTMALREAQSVAGRRAGIVLAAALFGVLHLPNPFLTAMTFGCALAWCAIYDRYPNVLPLALSHAVGTMVVRYALDDAVTGGLKIGASYLEMVR